MSAAAWFGLLQLLHALWAWSQIPRAGPVAASTEPPQRAATAEPSGD
jgi:hypothetical protein